MWLSPCLVVSSLFLHGCRILAIARWAISRGKFAISLFNRFLANGIIFDKLSLFAINGKKLIISSSSEKWSRDYFEKVSQNLICSKISKSKNKLQKIYIFQKIVLKFEENWSLPVVRVTWSRKIIGMVWLVLGFYISRGDLTKIFGPFLKRS